MPTIFTDSSVSLNPFLAWCLFLYLCLTFFQDKDKGEEMYFIYFQKGFKIISKR